MNSQQVFVYARINARVYPIDRGDRYEDPLEKALAAKGWGEVEGGGTSTRTNGEIEYCGIDLSITNVEDAIPFVCRFLETCGAPRGSKLTFDSNGQSHEVPFGKLEGLAIYFNGTDLADSVYAECDINYVYSEINRLLNGVGDIQGHWQGPRETALYLYGSSVETMKQRIAKLIAEYPLCEQARYETIA